MAGAGFGAGAAVFSGQAAAARAQQTFAGALDLRDAPIAPIEGTGARGEMLGKLIAHRAPERLDPPSATVRTPASGRPKIILVFDDMGLDHDAFDAVMAMPGPVTLSLLPYAPDLAPLTARAQARGDALMLHLPMEPLGDVDPGPNALRKGMSAIEFAETLRWNFERFDGYVAVNNHMGSRLTQDEAAMKSVLAQIDARGLFFLDSLTTGASVAAPAGAAVGADVYLRDVFLDAEPGREAVARQIRLAEAIAQETGFVVAICHPRADTLAMVGPWLTTALARGFELATVESLPSLAAAARDGRLAAAD